MQQTIKRALISVFHKENLDAILDKLNEQKVEIFSTGGTQKFIESKGISVNAIEDLTGYPSILGGRVKTLHPKIFGGILSRNENEGDAAELAEYAIPVFDLVIVDLYPFEKTIASTDKEQTIIEKIDIGGIALIRAAAKNYKDTLIISAQNQYNEFLAVLNENEGKTELATRRKFATYAFGISSHYDSAIFNYFNRKEGLAEYRNSYNKQMPLRYGENPHQQGVFFGDFDALFEKLHGKAISYNNLLDIDAAVNIIQEFEECTFAILKHNISCGLATRATLADAYKEALACDPLSAFGGILICNRKLDVDTAKQISELFAEVVIAPEFEAEALSILQQKKNLRILKQKCCPQPNKVYRSILNGLLEQDFDNSIEVENKWQFSTKRKPSEAEKEDLEFGIKVIKHVKSNGIVLVKNKKLIGLGSGQTSRVDALKQAITKAKHFQFDLSNAIMASDAFFPFPDCVEIAHQAGITAVIQPGGSIKDQASIEYCDNNELAMVLTGIRHFKH